MARSYATLVAGALALATAAVLIPVYAHEGHAKPAGATFDPDAPKRVSEATAMAIGLKTAEVDFGRVEDVLRLTGMVRARPDATFAVSPTFAGVVRSISVQPGDRVTKGMVVAELEIPELARLGYELAKLESEYEKLLADVARAKSRIVTLGIELPAAARGAELAEAEVERMTSAGASVPANVLTQRRADALKLRADAALREVELVQAEAEVGSLRRQAEAATAAAAALRGTLPGAGAGAAAGVDSGNALLYDPAYPGVVRFASPMDGVVVMRSVSPGSGVSAGAAIVTIGNFATVQIDGEVPESLIDRALAAGTAKVRVRRIVSEKSEAIGEGAVRFISPVVDAIKRTAHLIVEVDNAAGLLRPGQFVDLSVVLSENETAVVVPASAIVREGPLRFVFVTEGKGENVSFRKRDVATGISDDRVVEVKLGLVPGDVVVSSGAFSLSQLRGFVAVEPRAPGGLEKAKPTDGHGHTH